MGIVSVLPTHTHDFYILFSLFWNTKKKNTFNLISQLELLSYRYYCGKMCGNEGLWHTMKRSTVNSLIKDKIYVCVWVIFIRNQSSLIHFGLWGKDKRKIKQNKAFVTSNRWPLSCAHQLNTYTDTFYISHSSSQCANAIIYVCVLEYTQLLEMDRKKISFVR